MSVNAAYAKNVRARTSSGAGSSADAIGGLTSANFDRVRNMLDKTEFKDAGIETFVPGVKGVEISLEGLFDSADTPQGRLLTAYDTPTTVWIVYLPNGSTGWNVECYVEKFSTKGAAKDLETFSASLKATGAVAAI